MLIIFSGLPGSGKSTLARLLTKRLGAILVRADTIEQRLRRTVLSLPSIEDLGYLAGYAVAEDNLRLGHSVIADSVNPWELTRQAWRDAAENAGQRWVDIEVVCSNAEEHRFRVENRRSDIPGLVLPRWQDVVERDYHPWTTERIVVDTYDRDIEQCVDEIVKEIETRTQ